MAQNISFVNMSSRVRTLFVLFCALFAFSAMARAQDEPEVDSQATKILDTLYEASVKAEQSWDARQASLKDKLNGAQNTLQSIAEGVGSIASSTVDLVADTTAMVASFLVEDLKDPVEGAKGFIDVNMEKVSQAVSTMSNLVRRFATVLNTAAPKLPSWDTIKDPKAWPQSLMTYCQQVSEAMSGLIVEATGVFDGIEARFCTPAVLAPSTKRQGKIEGPSFKLTLSSGECEFAHSPQSSLENKEVDVTCTTPRLEFEKKPIHYISKHHSPVMFKGKECKRELAHGEEDEIVLFEIHPNLDIKSALDQATEKIQGSFEGVIDDHEKIVAELKGFAEDMVMDKDEEQLSETVARYDQAALEIAGGMAEGLISFTTGSGQTFSNGVRSLPGGWTFETVDHIEE